MPFKSLSRLAYQLRIFFRQGESSFTFFGSERGSVGGGGGGGLGLPLNAWGRT